MTRIVKQLLKVVVGRLYAAAYVRDLAKKADAFLAEQATLNDKRLGVVAQMKFDELVEHFRREADETTKLFYETMRISPEDAVKIEARIRAGEPAGHVYSEFTKDKIPQA
jgi:hypothetical protein